MKSFRVRYTIVGILFIAAFGVLVARLVSLQIVKGSEYLAQEQNLAQVPIRIAGPRGKILDSSGLPLAYNKTSYNITFTWDPSKSKDADRLAYTQSIIETYNIVTKNGGKFLSTFAIHKLADGSYDFDWPDINKTESPKTYQSRVDSWINNNKISGKIIATATPEQLFQQCCKYYNVPENASYDEQIAILSVWQEVRPIRFASYLSIDLADDVNYQTVAQVKMNRSELIGMDVQESSSRVYPNKSMAAHIIGYMGRMLDEPTMKSYKAMGYSSDDLVGLSGIEAQEELELSGNTSERSGQKVVEVDYMGRMTRVLSTDEKSPKPGNDVMLTLDSGLQKVLEQALADNIAQVKSAQQQHYNDDQYKAGYDAVLKTRVNKQDKSKPAEVNWASEGAAVVMDVQTGSLLAMASYPTFDPNMFTGGLSEADYAKLKEIGNPLFNNAISSRGTPGSIFKMCTGLAGLMEGAITLTTKIDDKSPDNDHIDPGSGEVGPKCYIWPSTYKHSDQDIIKALKNSCDYFFYKTADMTGTAKLNDWADKLGLTTKTGVELPNEMAGQMASQKTLYSSTNMSGVAALVRNKIVSMLKQECESLGMKYTDDKYTAAAIKMMDLVNQGLTGMGPDIRATLKNDLKLTAADIVKANLDNEISQTLSEIQWNPNMLLVAGIGQSTTLLTPIGVVRYVSALVNGGNVYEARLVKSVISPDGKRTDTTPKLLRNLDIPQEYLDAIKQGMADVVSSTEGGTAAKMFVGFKYVDNIGGKTGTAQVSPQMDLENNSWFVAFTPLEKPEIAIAVYIPHGYEGYLSGYTAKMIVQYYLDRKNNVAAEDDMPLPGTLVP